MKKIVWTVMIGSLAVAGAGEGRAQSSELGAPETAALIVRLAAFHDSVFGGPLDSCAVERVTGVSPRLLVDAEPSLIRHLDLMEAPCETPRHHAALYNRGFLESIEVSPERVEVRLQGWVSDRSTRWTLHLAGPDPTWTLVEARSGGDLYVHGGENRAPEETSRHLLDALRSLLGPDLRVDPRLGLWKPESRFFSVIDLSDVEPAVRTRTLGVADVRGRFLERAACWVTPGELDAPPIRDLRLDPEDCVEGSSTDVMLGAPRGRPPNRWLQHAWAVEDGRLRVFEADFSWEGELLELRTLTEIPTRKPTPGRPRRPDAAIGER